MLTKHVTSLKQKKMFKWLYAHYLVDIKSNHTKFNVIRSEYNISSNTAVTLKYGHSH